MEQTVGSRDLEGPRAPVGGALLSSLMTLGTITAIVAVLLMWTFLTEPVEVARTVRHGGTADVARLVASAVYDLVARLLAWL